MSEKARRDAAKLRKLLKQLRQTAGLEADDLVFVTFHTDEIDRYAAAMKILGPQNVVLDGDRNVRKGRLLVSKLRMDRHAAGETQP